MARSVLFGLLFVFGLLLAPSAEAQYIDCGGPQGPCSETKYGLGNDPFEGPHTRTRDTNRQSRGDGACTVEVSLRMQGQMTFRELDNCAVTADNRCEIEIPGVAGDPGLSLDSGLFNLGRNDFDLGPAGLFAALGGVFYSYGGNIGYRQLHGTCSLDAGEECGLNSDCPSNAGCVSSCFSTGEVCSGHADCPNADCITEIEFDGIGTCTDDATKCTSDADCGPAPDFCEAGFDSGHVVESCGCCQSSLGTICQSLISIPEYPIIPCGSGLDGLFTERNRIRSPDLVFNGGRGTKFDAESIIVPGQQEGICNGNRQRSCGPNGDLWAGALNGKCQNSPATCQSDPFDLSDPALPSTCDDVAFGGIAGDFCDITEDGYRCCDSDLNADGSPTNNRCPNSWWHLEGTPNELCHFPIEVSGGDPQPGCRLFNIGLNAAPDLNCNGVLDTVEGSCTPAAGGTCTDLALCPPCGSDADCEAALGLAPGEGQCITGGDLCPAVGELRTLEDSNRDGIGDECQCGDQSADGAISSLDIGGIALCANAAAPLEDCDPTIVDATGDNATTAEDIAGIVAVVNGIVSPGDLSCIRNP